MPTPSVWTSTGPSAAGGSGTSVRSTESFWSGTTVTARMDARYRPTPTAIASRLDEGGQGAHGVDLRPWGRSAHRLVLGAGVAGRPRPVRRPRRPRRRPAPAGPGRRLPAQLPAPAPDSRP